MRTLNRPPRLGENPDSGSSRKGERALDAVTRRRIRDDRLFGALCHAGIFLGLWGLVTTTAIWAFRKDRSRVLRFQGAQAILYQCAVRVVLFLGAAASVLWLRYGSSEPNADTLKQSVEAISLWTSSGVLAGFVLSGGTFHPFTGLALLEAAFGFIAFLLILLCLVGLEPSYPLVGFVTRRVLGLRIEKPVKKEKETPKPEPEPEKPVPDTTT